MFDLTKKGAQQNESTLMLLQQTQRELEEYKAAYTNTKQENLNLQQENTDLQRELMGIKADFVHKDELVRLQQLLQEAKAENSVLSTRNKELVEMLAQKQEELKQVISHADKILTDQCDSAEAKCNSTDAMQSEKADKVEKGIAEIQNLCAELYTMAQQNKVPTNVVLSQNEVKAQQSTVKVEVTDFSKDFVGVTDGKYDVQPTMQSN